MTSVKDMPMTAASVRQRLKKLLPDLDEEHLEPLLTLDIETLNGLMYAIGNALEDSFDCGRDEGADQANQDNDLME